MAQETDINTIGVLIRGGSNVIIKKHPVATGRIILSQTIDNTTESIIINTYEVYELIDILKGVMKLIYSKNT